MKVFIVLVISMMVMGAKFHAPKLHNGEFQGKVVLVTGGSSGIGYEAALEFARSGARVIIAARDSNPAWFNGTSAANKINSDSEVKASNGSARFVKTDISNGTSVENLFTDILKNERTLDIAVNNAGIGGGLGYINELKKYLRTEHDPISNNLYGAVNLLIEETQYFISTNKTGVIVNTASVNGLTGTPMGALYGASKFGIASLTRSVALEFLVPDATRQTPRIRVNAVAPGLVDTSLTWQQVKYFADGKTQPWEGEYITPDSPLWQKYGQAWIDELRGKKISQPSNQAAMILFLASDAASYISGAVINVDNGEIA